MNFQLANLASLIFLQSASEWAIMPQAAALGRDTSLETAYRRAHLEN